MESRGGGLGTKLFKKRPHVQKTLSLDELSYIKFSKLKQEAEPLQRLSR